MDEVPEYVSRAAQEHRLGELVVWRKASNPFVTFIIATGITVIGGGLLLGVLWVLSRFIETLDTAVGAIVVVAGVALVGSAVAGVYALVKGFTAHYVYEHGAIQTRNRRVGVQKWEQLDEVAENWAGFPNNPSMVSILVRFFDGRRWEIEALPTGNQTERDRQLLTAFTDRALQQGRPVIHLPRVDIEEEFMPPRFLITVVVVLLVVVTCGLGGVLRGANLPDMLAYAIGFLTAGLGTWVIGQAFRWLRIMGMVFAALGGFSLIIYVTNVLSSVNVFLIGLATFALELLAVWGLGRLNAALMPVIGSVWRFVNAVVRGWRFRPRADIPLPSPTTAGRIMSVPPSSTSTRGRSVVTFTVNGQRVTVFDRVRPRPRLADVPQTVWMVHLPEPQPFHDYPDGSWVDGPARWYVRTSRFRMGASPRVIAAIAARLTAARVAPAGTLD